MQFDESVRILVDAAFAEQKDVFLQCSAGDFSKFFFGGVKTVLLLPGKVFPPAVFRYASVQLGCFYDVYSDGSRIIADIRAMGNDVFRAYLTANGYRRLIVPFADCSDSAEYGHRQGFLWVWEYKAEISHFCQLVQIYSSAYREMNTVLEINSDKKAVFAGRADLPCLRIHETLSQPAKLYFTAQEIEKLAYGTHAVFFNSRNEASEFCAILKKRRTECVYLDGAVSTEEIKRRLERICYGDARVLVVTKSGIPLLPFMDIDKASLCGIPFSSGYLGRVADACRKSDIDIIFTESDFKRNAKILEYFRLKECDEEIYRKRVEKLSEISDIIINKKLKEQNYERQN